MPRLGAVQRRGSSTHEGLSANVCTVVVSHPIAAEREGLPVQPGGDIAADVPGVPSMQHPTLTAHDGGRGITQDQDAYRLVVEACEAALTTLCVSESCEIALLRLSRLARRAGRLRARGPRPLQVRQLG